MESIGSLLKDAREAKGYTIEQVARDTNIAKRYLQAMEMEDTSVFPGETYFIGFLRNYSDFLGLDPEKLIGLFRNLKIQEQQPPMEELLVKPRKPWIPVVLLLVVLVAAAVAVWIFFGDQIFGESGEKESLPAETVEPEEVEIDEDRLYEFKEEILERSFSRGDQISLNLSGQTYVFVIGKTAPPAEIILNGETEVLELGKASIFDLDGDDVGDLKIVLRQYLADEDKAVLYFDKYVESVDPELREIAVAEEPRSELAAVSLGETSDPDRMGTAVVLLEADRPEPFDLDVVFRGLCLFRYVVDNEIREERYFHKSEVFKLEVAQEVRLWISNAGSFKGKIQGVDVPLGSPGEISTRLIRWEKHESGKYQLKLIPMY